ncbi:WYL domain-containing protein [Dactylosporangium sp. NPDC050588]|uniref:helix-turn-helix transcriptional regulator n=1 Tax=Dactylosporangium sp. NPDC050588 TaxID=3157211 RepID=UPI0033EA537E
MEVRYRRWAPRPAVVGRRLHPLGLVLKAGVWYLVAAGRGEPRTYRVSAIVELRRLPEKFTRPDGFDLTEFWHAHVERYEQAETAEAAVVRLSPAGIAALPDILGPRAGRLAACTLTPADPDGWRCVTIPLESVDHAAASLLRPGADAQALAPPELVARITATIRAMTRTVPASCIVTMHCDRVVP